MAWVKVSDDRYDKGPLAEMRPLTMLLFNIVECKIAGNLSDGRITDRMLKQAHITAGTDDTHVEELVGANVWAYDEEGLFDTHYLSDNWSREQAENFKRTRSQNGRKGGRPQKPEKHGEKHGAFLKHGEKHGALEKHGARHGENTVKSKMKAVPVPVPVPVSVPDVEEVVSDRSVENRQSLPDRPTARDGTADRVHRNGTAPPDEGRSGLERDLIAVLCSREDFPRDDGQQTTLRARETLKSYRSIDVLDLAKHFTDAELRNPPSWNLFRSWCRRAQQEATQMPARASPTPTTAINPGYESLAKRALVCDEFG